MSLPVIDDKAIAELTRIKEHGEQNPYSLEDIMALVNQTIPMPGNQSEYRCFLFEGYKVVFHTEYQPLGLCRHASISLNMGMPDKNSLELILPYLGFTGSFNEWHKHVETTNSYIAINIIQKI